MSADATEQGSIHHYRAALATPSGVLDGIPNPVFIKDKNGRYLYLNQVARDNLGLDDRSYIGKTDRQLFAIDIADLRYQSDQRALLSEQPIRYKQWLMVKGQSRCFLTTKRAVRDEQGEVLAIFGSAQDLSQEDIQLDSDSGAFARPQFIANFSHELRTPLNAILGFSQLLSSQLELGTDQQDSARLIEKAGRHLAELIDQLIDLVKMDSGVGQFNMEYCPLNEILEDCNNIVAPLAAQRHIKVNMSPPAEPLGIMVDHLKMRQVLLNVLGNAIKYNHEYGQVFIETEQQGEWLAILIRDTGPGIPSDKHHLVFEPFHRLGAETSKIEGTGLGLSICKQMVDRMGGRIDLLPDSGSGCTFRLRFKLAESAGASSAILNAFEQSSDWGAPALDSTKRRVLYIEDNATNVRFLQLLLAEHQQVFAVTADAMPDQVDEATNAGVHGYLTKPLDIAQIRGLVS
jgi:PAS domain S-box-containing protein